MSFSSRGLGITGVNARESEGTVRRYARELGLTFPLVLDQDGQINGALRSHRAPDDVRRGTGWTRHRLCHRNSPVGACVGPRARRAAAGRAGPKSGRPVKAGRGVLLVFAIVLATAGGMTCVAETQSPRLVKIGALTESWGPTPSFAGLRDGLQELGYRENQDFVLGVRFTQGNVAELPEAARALVRHGGSIHCYQWGGQCGDGGPDGNHPDPDRLHGRERPRIGRAGEGSRVPAGTSPGSRISTWSSCPSEWRSFASSCRA